MEQMSELKVQIPDGISLPDFIIGNCHKYEDRKALIDSVTEESYTYRELKDLITRCSLALSNLGVRSGDRVCIYLPNCMEYPVLYLSIINIQAICVPVSHTSTSYELDYYLRDTESILLVASSSNVHILDQMMKKLQSKHTEISCLNQLKRIIIVNHSSSNPPRTMLNERYVQFDDFISGTLSRSRFLSEEMTVESEDKLKQNTCLSRDVATICYSSGTTGKPKGCEQTNYSYIANIIMQCSHPDLQFNSDIGEVTIAVLPFFHMFGQVIYLTHALYAGVTMVVCEKFCPQTYLHLINKYQATYLHCVPPIITAVTSYVENKKLELERITAKILQDSNSASSSIEDIPILSTTNNPISGAKLYMSPAYTAKVLENDTSDGFSNSEAATSTIERTQATEAITTLAGGTVASYASRATTTNVAATTDSINYMKGVRCIISSAASLSTSTVARFQRLFPDTSLIQGFGMTECMLVLLATSKTSKVGSCGVLLPNCRAKIVDPNTSQIVGAGNIGEIFVHSPSLMKGYFRNEHATKDAFDSSSYMRTGDIGYYDEDGHFYIVGRLKEQLRYKGHQIAPIELETVLLQHPSVADAAVIGIPDEVLGDLPKAYVVLQNMPDNTPKPTVRELINFVHAHVSPYKYLRGGLEITDHIPKSASGKILKRILLEKEMLNRRQSKL